MNLNIYERRALRNLQHVCNLNEVHLQVGKGTIRSLLEKLWIERLPDGTTGARYYRITPEGRVALTFPVKKMRRPNDWGWRNKQA